MTRPPAAQRRFLFLQGPPGPFFRLLGDRIAAMGAGVHRLNLNGGDRYDWPDAPEYRGALPRWPLFVDQYMRDHGITDLVFYGDCRPMHRDAHGVAKLLKVDIHVLEEGYVRPDWMTFEPDGVNAHSTLRRDPAWLLQEASTLPPLEKLPGITASFRRRARDSFAYYQRVMTGRWRFRHYRSHRPTPIVLEAAGWIARYLRRRGSLRRAERLLPTLDGARFFLFPMQLSADYQIRLHSPFEDMRSAAEYVIANFARHAPPGSRLVVKEHPLDNGFVNWDNAIAQFARRYGVAGRVDHINGGDLLTLSEQSRGVVCVNSTSGTLALDAGTPVIVLGSALYDIPGITHQGLLDDFWSSPQRPDPVVHDAFRRVLQARCLVRGGLASQSATATLIESIVGRLFDRPPDPVEQEIPGWPTTSPDRPRPARSAWPSRAR